MRSSDGVFSYLQVLVTEAVSDTPPPGSELNITESTRVGDAMRVIGHDVHVDSAIYTSLRSGMGPLRRDAFISNAEHLSTVAGSLGAPGVAASAAALLSCIAFEAPGVMAERAPAAFLASGALGHLLATLGNPALPADARHAVALIVASVAAADPESGAWIAEEVPRAVSAVLGMSAVMGVTADLMGDSVAADDALRAAAAGCVRELLRSEAVAEQAAAGGVLGRLISALAPTAPAGVVEHVAQSFLALAPHSAAESIGAGRHALLQIALAGTEASAACAGALAELPGAHGLTADQVVALVDTLTDAARDSHQAVYRLLGRVLRDDDEAPCVALCERFPVSRLAEMLTRDVAGGADAFQFAASAVQHWMARDPAEGAALVGGGVVEAVVAALPLSNEHPADDRVVAAALRILWWLVHCHRPAALQKMRGLRCLDRRVALLL